MRSASPFRLARPIGTWRDSACSTTGPRATPELGVPTARPVPIEEFQHHRRGRDHPSRNEISWSKIAAIRGVVSDELRYSPVHVTRAAEGGAVGRKPLLPEAGRDKKYFEIEVERSFPLIPIIPQVRQRPRISFRTRILLPSKGNERI